MGEKEKNEKEMKEEERSDRYQAVSCVALEREGLV